MAWLVIEGDNGVGKDTVASQLCIGGWSLLNQHEAIDTLIQDARGVPLNERYEAFMEVNRRAAELLKSMSGNVVLVRYWPSSVAAAYADELISWEILEHFVSSNAENLPQPDLYLELRCNPDERARRIVERGGRRLDDTTQRRATFHRQALTYIATKIPDWEVIDTTSHTPAVVGSQVDQMIERIV